jgi:hypothetical protein
VKYLLCVSLIVLVGCSSPKVPGYTGARALSEADIILATKECRNAYMKPVIQYYNQKTEFGEMKIPVNVICEIYK